MSDMQNVPIKDTKLNGHVHFISVHKCESVVFLCPKNLQIKRHANLKIYQYSLCKTLESFYIVLAPTSLFKDV